MGMHGVLLWKMLLPGWHRDARPEGIPCGATLCPCSCGPG